MAVTVQPETKWKRNETKEVYYSHLVYCISQYYWEIKWHKKLVSWYSPIFCRQDSNLHHGLTFLGDIFDFCFLQQRQSEPQNVQPICLNNMCETKSILNLVTPTLLHFPVSVQQFHAAFSRQCGRQLAITQNVISQLQLQGLSPKDPVRKKKAWYSIQHACLQMCVWVVFSELWYLTEGCM